jgi:hippurate hydrolase
MSAQATLEKIRPLVPELVAIRRDIHAHPELGLEEHRTAALVAEKLKSWGIETTEGVGGTGVVGTIRGKLPGQRSIGLRADMDALALTEQTALPYASQTEGKMHACGHDGHTTMLLGAARHLSENRDFAGTVQLIFQPAEEGRGGAAKMLADRLFERFPCDAVYGLHNMPGIPLGHFAIRKGAYMASAARWDVKFTGNGGHGGASPYLVADLSIVQAHFVLGLQTIIGRNISALDSAVISVGYIGGGSINACNVMPSELTVSGTSRCFSKEIQEVLDRRMRELAEGLAKLHGAQAEVTIAWGAPTVINHDEQVDVAIAAATELVGANAVTGNARPITGGEDFGYMLEVKPGSFIFLGNGTNPDGSYHAVHTPKYDFNDEIIPLGVAYWIGLVKQELNLRD